MLSPYGDFESEDPLESEEDPLESEEDPLESEEDPLVSEFDESQIGMDAESQPVELEDDESEDDKEPSQQIGFVNSATGLKDEFWTKDKIEMLIEEVLTRPHVLGRLRKNMGRQVMRSVKEQLTGVKVNEIDDLKNEVNEFSLIGDDEHQF